MQRSVLGEDLWPRETYRLKSLCVLNSFCHELVGGLKAENGGLSRLPL